MKRIFQIAGPVLTKRFVRPKVQILGVNLALLMLMAGCGGGSVGGGSPVTTSTNNPVPSIASLSPSSATAGAAAQTLTINGANFLSTSTVTYNGVGHAATFVSATKLTISVSASDEATAGLYPVLVTNPAPGGGASNSVSFTVNSAESVSVETGSLPSGTVGAAYTQTTLSATGGTAPYTWSITAGALPLGMTLSSQGNISGTPLAIDTPSFTVQATDSSSSHLSGTRELSITVNASSAVHNAITVSGSNVTGIDISLSSMTTTLGLADVGSCGSPNPSGECLASVTGIQISRSGSATSSCPKASCTVWLLGQGLSDAGGATVRSGLTVLVSQGTSADVSIGNVEAGPVTSGLSGINFTVTVSATAALGNRNIFVTLPDGETQAYLGGIQVVE